MNYRRGLGLTLLLLMLAVLQSFAGTVRLSVSPGRGYQNISVGDIFYITYNISNIDEEPDEPTNVPGAHLNYFDQTSQSSSFSSINGNVSQSVSYVYTATLRAQKEGSYTFGPITVGGVKSNIVSYTILPQGKGGGASSSQNNMGPEPTTSGIPTNDGKPKFIGKGDGNLFLRADVSRSTAYPQEALVYTVKLYTTFDAIKFIGATAAPKFEGFVVEESKDISTSLVYEQYNGKMYASAVIARYIIFPQMEGNLTVKGNTYTVSVDEREYYHDPFWGNMAVARPLQLNVTPNDLTVNVKPLPKPIPDGFSGGVGQFTLSSQLPTETFLTNTAASIVYTVSGTGNLKYVTLPDLNTLYPAQLEVYTPTTEVEVNVGKSNVSGKVVFDYSFMPQETGEFTIPEVSLIYFNPNTGQYEKSTTRGYKIKVGQGQGSENSQTRHKLTFNDKLESIGDNLKFDNTPIIQTFGFWLIFYIIPAVLLIAIFIYYRNYLKANSDLIAVKSRKANKVARQRLKKARICMNKGQTDKFYDVLLESMWGYLGDKLKMPTSELSRANIREEFEKRGINTEIADKVIEIVDDCEYYKYSSAGAAKDMNEVYDMTADVIDLLEKSLNQKTEKIENKEV